MNILYEAKLNTEKRNELKDSEFGLPKKRKFPLNDKEHVSSAIRFFRFAKPDERKELANNIKKAIKKFNMDVNIDKDSLLYKYMKPEYTAESVNYFNNYNKTDLTIRYDDIEFEIIERYRNMFKLLQTQLSVEEHDKINIEFSQIDHDNFILNGYLELCSKYDQYQHETTVNTLMIKIYKDIVDMLNDCIINESFYNKLANKLLEVIKYLLSFKQIDHKNFFIRNIYRYCIPGRKLQLFISIQKMIEEINPDRLDSPDINYIINILGDNDMYHTTKYLENRVNDFHIYIKDIASVDDYGYPIKKPSLESVTKSNNNNITFMNEAFTIDERGTIKIVLNPKESYMDEYSNCHKILHENYKNKNYEAMKTNLAFMFYLISRIEKDKRYKSREPEVVKARAFAMNDFKTYLAHLQKQEPEFNFVEYYKQSDIGKYIISIPKETIIGIKKLFQAIIT